MISWSITKNRITFNKKCNKPSAKSVLILLGLIAAASAADSGIHKNILGSGRRHSSSLVPCPPIRDALHKTTTLIISNDKKKTLLN